MDAEYEEKLARTINEMKSIQQQNENPESPLMRKSSCDSASNFDVLDNIQEASKCQLFLPHGTTKVLCAMGMVYPAKQVHGKSVLQGHAKVHVDKVEANYKDYILPVQTEEFNTLGETLFSFIQWPKKYKELTKAFNSNQTGNKKIVAANTSTQTATKQIVATNKDSSTQKQTSPNLSRQEGPSNYIAAAPPTKRARPLNSVSMDDPGRPPGIVLSAATSFWIPIQPKQVFGFLWDENFMSEDVISNGGSVQEMARITNGRD
ncbi:hypothetical protein Tco_1223766 [Tanacetum coccineum]